MCLPGSPQHLQSCLCALKVSAFALATGIGGDVAFTAAADIGSDAEDRSGSEHLENLYHLGPTGRSVIALVRIGRVRPMIRWAYALSLSNAIRSLTDQGFTTARLSFSYSRHPSCQNCQGFGLGTLVQL